MNSCLSLFLEKFLESQQIHEVHFTLKSWCPNIYFALSSPMPFKISSNLGYRKMSDFGKRTTSDINEKYLFLLINTHFQQLLRLGFPSGRQYNLQNKLWFSTNCYKMFCLIAKKKGSFDLCPKSYVVQSHSTLRCLSYTARE